MPNIRLIKYNALLYPRLLRDPELLPSMSHKTPKYLEAIKNLPEALVPVFDELLEHYKFAALKHHGREMASPLVIAELVLLGWRNSETARGSRSLGSSE